jgi:hypothetical protein
VQGGDGLLVDRFHRDGVVLPVTSGLEQGLGIGPVGLGPVAVAADLGGRQEGHAVPVGLELAGPVMGRAASFHQDIGRWVLGEEALEAAPGEPTMLVHHPGRLRDGDVEDRLCHVYGNQRSVHLGLLSPIVASKGRSTSGTLVPFGGRSPSHQLPPRRCRSSGLRHIAA